AQEAHRIATLRYQEGVGTSVEILDAEAALEGAKTRLNGALFGLNLAVAQLDLAGGLDWSESYSASAPAEAAGE
ncbi:MAG: TolC family protein, partial [Proteobacteria bacterium]|nr:TolC family protein [Pseudomonadota bacterium]